VGRAGLVPRCCHSATLLLRLPVLLQLGFGWGKEWRVHDCRLPSMSGVRTVTVSLWLWECSCRMGRWDHGRDVLFWAKLLYGYSVYVYFCLFNYNTCIYIVYINFFVNKFGYLTEYHRILMGLPPHRAVTVRNWTESRVYLFHLLVKFTSV
jgi:hypothetical protein